MLSQSSELTRLCYSPQAVCIPKWLHRRRHPAAAVSVLLLGSAGSPQCYCWRSAAAVCAQPSLESTSETDVSMSCTYMLLCCVPQQIRMSYVCLPCPHGSCWEACNANTPRNLTPSGCDGACLRSASAKMSKGSSLYEPGPCRLELLACVIRACSCEPGCVVLVCGLQRVDKQAACTPEP